MPGRALIITGDKHHAALVLLASNWPDARIARVFDVSTSAVFNWRARNGLAVGHTVPRIDENMAHRLYSEGVSDNAMARELGVTQSGVTRWRQRRGLDANFEFAVIGEDRRAAAKQMLKRGATRREVAEALFIHMGTVQKIRNKMRGQRGLRSTGVTRRAGTRRTAVQQPTEVHDRIVKAIGRSISPDIAADAAGDMWLALLEGRLSIDDIEKAARGASNKVIGTFASKYGPLSLDEQRDEDGLSLGDRIADPASLAPYERIMGG